MSMQLTAVGLGPGDPELITLKGWRAIQAADLIFVPQSKSGEKSLALRIAEPHVDPTRQQIVTLPLPMTRNVDELVTAWQSAADAIWAAFAERNQSSNSRLDIFQGEAGCTLDNLAICGLLLEDSPTLSDSKPSDSKGVYLLLGDPLLYGTFTYIWSELAVRYPAIHVSIVPGITSFAAAAATTQISLGATSDRVAILPASYETDVLTLKQLLVDFETIVLMKAGPVLPQLLRTLDELELLDSTIYAERVGMPEEKVVTDLRQLPAEPAPYLSLLIVRKG